MHKKILSHPIISTVLFTCLLGWISTYLAVNFFRTYAFGLFVWLPIVMGVFSTILSFRMARTDQKPLKRVPFISILVFCLGLLAFAFEGLICIIMALPLGVFFTWLGYFIGCWILRKKWTKGISVAMCMLTLSVPGVSGIESLVDHGEPIRCITSRINIHAPIENVWKNVVEFPAIAPPTETLFKIGIAYPTHAYIDGSGVGAIRTCHFSTGSFVEPITVWNEPYLLKFKVVDQPEPMTELSPYAIHPTHLHGYFVSRQGQFKLVKLSDTETRLEGSTWYFNRIQPDFYWVLWSDYIIHAIHNRVLEHIKAVSERVSG